MPPRKGTPEQLGDLKPATYNPRFLSPEAAAGLQRSMQEFGDLSGLVYNVSSRQMVCGHQRKRQLPEDARIVQETAESDRLGTVGYGYAEALGTRWRVRFVDWTAPKEKAANLAANNPFIAGEFTSGLSGVLDSINLEMPDIAESLRLCELEVPSEGATTSEPISARDKVAEQMRLRPFEHWDYVCFVFRDSRDYLSCLNALFGSIREEPAQGEKKIGSVRVVDGIKLKEVLDRARDHSVAPAP